MLKQSALSLIIITFLWQAATLALGNKERWQMKEWIADDMYFPFLDLAIHNGLLYLIALLLVYNLYEKYRYSNYAHIVLITSFSMWSSVAVAPWVNHVQELAPNIWCQCGSSGLLDGIPFSYLRRYIFQCSTCVFIKWLPQERKSQGGLFTTK